MLRTYFQRLLAGVSRASLRAWRLVLFRDPGEDGPMKPRMLVATGLAAAQLLLFFCIGLWNSRGSDSLDTSLLWEQIRWWAVFWGSAILVWAVTFACFLFPMVRRITSASAAEANLRAILEDGLAILADLQAAEKTQEYGQWEGPFERAKVWQRQRLPDALAIYPEVRKAFDGAGAVHTDYESPWPIARMWIPAILTDCQKLGGAIRVASKG